MGNRDALDVRLGAIYALERVAHDSVTHRAVSYEVLAAYIRGHGPWPPKLPGQYVEEADVLGMPGLEYRAMDVHVALRVLGRRSPSSDDEFS